MHYDGLRNGVHEGLMQDGRRYFLLPPVPSGHTQQPSMIPDYIAYPEILGRTQQTLPGGSRDSKNLLDRNVYGNRLLGPMVDWKDLWGKEQGKTCVIPCPGPSLTESLPELAVRVKDDDVFTVGFNRSHRVMDLDYFVLVDRIGQPDWITRDVGDTVLIASTCGCTSIAANFTPRYWGEHFMEGVDEGLTRLHSGLCITLCDAMNVAYHLGAEKIELYGCDFAISGRLGAGPGDGKICYLLEKYYVDQKSHVGTDARRGTFPQSWPVTGIDGRMVFVNYELMAYAGYTTAMCMMLRYAGVEVVNKSKTGILFWGFNE